MSATLLSLSSINGSYSILLRILNLIFVDFKFLMAITEVLSLTPRNSCSAMTNPFNSFSALIQSLEIVLQKKKESNLISILRSFCLFSLGMSNTKFGHKIARYDEEMFAHTQHGAPALLVPQLWHRTLWV